MKEVNSKIDTMDEDTDLQCSPYPALAVHQHPAHFSSPLMRDINLKALLRGPTSFASKALQTSWTFPVVLA